MNTLTFKILLNNYAFQVFSTPKNVLCSYFTHDKHKASLIFAKNIYARLYHKNVSFHGTSTRRDNWIVRVDEHIVVNKKYNNYYFESSDYSNKNEPQMTVHLTDPFPDNVLNLYNETINYLSDYYSCIENKKIFQQQLCEYFEENYFDYHSLCETIEYENYENIADDEEPIIEKISLKDEVLNDCKAMFISFHNAESDYIQRELIFTLENVINEMPELNDVPHNFLLNAFNKYISDNYKNLVTFDLHYERYDVLYTIGTDILNSYEYAVFLDSIEERIETILKSMAISFADRQELFYAAKNRFSKEDIPDNNTFKEYIISLINEHTEFNKLREKFISLFGTNEIVLEWNDDKIRKFQDYENLITPISQVYSPEYEAYKYVAPYMKQHLFKKNSTKNKDVIKSFPAFIDYASSILDILFKHNILVDNNNQVTYNEHGNIKAAQKEMKILTDTR